MIRGEKLATATAGAFLHEMIHNQIFAENSPGQLSLNP